MENSSRNKKNEPVEIMCSRIKEEKHTKHTNEHGWTTINANSSRKPKRKNSQQTSIESIISTINIDTKNDKKGAPEAKIDSPVLENRCTLPNKINKQEDEEKEKENQTNEQPTQIAPTTGEATGKDPTANNMAINEAEENERYNKEKDISSKDKSSNKGQEEEREDRNRRNE
jgi:hypothetical protein